MQMWSRHTLPLHRRRHDALVQCQSSCLHLTSNTTDRFSSHLTSLKSWRVWSWLISDLTQTHTQTICSLAVAFRLVLMMQPSASTDPFSHGQSLQLYEDHDDTTWSPVICRHFQMILQLCVRYGQEKEYTGLVDNFVEWCESIHQLLNVIKTKEMLVDFRRTTTNPISILREDKYKKYKYKYIFCPPWQQSGLEVQHGGCLQEGTEQIFLRELKSFNVCS